MPAQYKYIKINGRYYTLKQNPVTLAWFLYFNNKSFQLRSGPKKNCVLRTVIKLILHQLHLRNDATVLDVSACGNLCLRVHRGYKVFHFHRKTVTKIISLEINQSAVLNEMEAVRNAAQLDFAPNVLRWDITNRWYEEDLISGYPCYPADKSEAGGFLKIFHRHILPCLEQMILLHPPKTIDLMEHVNKTITVMQDRKLSNPKLDDNKILHVRNYLKSIVDRLAHKGNLQIYLVFSHGDYSLVNILKTKDGIMVIDWEGAGFRNPLFDLHNYFLTELYYKRATTSLIPEVNEAISSLQLRLTAKSVELAETLETLAPIYRRLYYLERICMLLDRELNNKLLDVVLRSIAVFSRYEYLASD